MWDNIGLALIDTSPHINPEGYDTVYHFTDRDLVDAWELDNSKPVKALCGYIVSILYLSRDQMMPCSLCKKIIKEQECD